MSLVYTTWKHGAIRGGGTARDWKNDAGVKMLLLGVLHAHPDHVYVSELTGELACTGYVGGFAGAGRKSLGSRDVVLDLTLDLVKLTSSNPATWTAIDGATVRYAVAAREVTVDADSPLIFCIDINPTAGIVFDGSDWTLGMPTNGWARF